VNAWAADHTTTLAGGEPILVLDMFEHAYHMDYGAKAGDYVDAFMRAIRWANADGLYAQYSRAGVGLTVPGGPAALGIPEGAPAGGDGLACPGAMSPGP